MAHTQTMRSARIDLRVDPEIKRLAERASAVLGCATLAEFITILIRDNAPSIIENAAVIKLTNEQFDSFIEACNNTEVKPSQYIIDAAKKLDSEGY